MDDDNDEAPPPRIPRAGGVLRRLFGSTDGVPCTDTVVVLLPLPLHGEDPPHDHNDAVFHPTIVMIRKATVPSCRIHSIHERQLSTRIQDGACKLPLL